MLPPLYYYLSVYAGTEKTEIRHSCPVRILQIFDQVLDGMFFSRLEEELDDLGETKRPKSKCFQFVYRKRVAPNCLSPRGRVLGFQLSEP